MWLFQFQHWNRFFFCLDIKPMCSNPCYYIFFKKFLGLVCFSIPLNAELLINIKACNRLWLNWSFPPGLYPSVFPGTSFVHLRFQDKRVADWPLMWAYWPTFALTAVYLLVVYVGPKLMKDHEPFSFKWLLFFYNMALVALNFHICSEVCLVDLNFTDATAPFWHLSYVRDLISYWIKVHL